MTGPIKEYPATPLHRRFGPHLEATYHWNFSHSRWEQPRRNGAEGTQEKTRLAGGATVSKDVLVVDDEPYLCDLIADVLEAEGHVTRKAAHGLEALERIRERTPQLILLDLMMPVMDGWEFVRALNGYPEFANIPIVIVTADYNMKRKQQVTGAKAIINKPFDIDELTEIVRIYAA